MGEAVEAGFRRMRAALALLALACLGLGACEVPRALNPVEIYREVSGANDAARPTPPGLDRPFPSLGSVPPRPDRPSPEAREAITAALAADRSRSREPLALRPAPGDGAPAAAAGMSAGPPARPALTTAPRIPWAEAPPVPGGGPPAATPAATPSARPSTPRPGVPAVPDAAPAPPPPDLLGAPPPPPAPDLLAPPPARR